MQLRGQHVIYAVIYAVYVNRLYFSLAYRSLLGVGYGYTSVFSISPSTVSPCSVFFFFLSLFIFCGGKSRESHQPHFISSKIWWAKHLSPKLCSYNCISQLMWPPHEIVAFVLYQICFLCAWLSIWRSCRSSGCCYGNYSNKHMKQYSYCLSLSRVTPSLCVRWPRVLRDELTVSWGLCWTASKGRNNNSFKDKVFMLRAQR